MEKITLLDISNPKKIKETINNVIENNEALSQENAELAGAVQDKLSEIVEEQNTTQQIQQQIQQTQGQFREEIDAAQQEINQAVESVADKADVYIITRVEYAAEELPSPSWINKDFGGAKIVSLGSLDYSAENFYNFSSGAKLYIARDNGPPTPAFQSKDGEIIYLVNTEGQYPTAVDLPFILPDDVGTLLDTSEFNMDIWIQFPIEVETAINPEYNYKTKADKYIVAGSIAVGEDLSGKKLKFDTTVNWYATASYSTMYIYSSGGYTIGTQPLDIGLWTVTYDQFNVPTYTLVVSFGSYDMVSTASWYMSEYTLPDDFGTVTKIETDYSAFVSLDSVKVDCEYNYKAIQEIKGGSGDSTSEVVGYKWSDTFDDTALACCIVGAYDEWDEHILQSMLFYKHMAAGNMQAQGIVAYVDENNTYWFSVTSISTINGTISNTFTQLFREEIDKNDFVKRYVTAGEGPPFHECTFRYLVKE